MAETEIAAVERKPFHESIVDILNGLTDIDDLELVERLLMVTKIPKGHDEIIEALTDATQEAAHENIKEEVLASILEQKELAKVASAEKGKTPKKILQAETKQTGPSFSKPKPRRAFSGF